MSSTIEDLIRFIVLLWISCPKRTCNQRENVRKKKYFIKILYNLERLIHFFYLEEYDLYRRKI